MPETDFEKERRLLRELEGKNVANYRVLLTALIRTTVENIRTVVVLSASGIGLTFAVLMLGGVHCGVKLILVAGAFLGFFVSLMLGLSTLERNAQYLTQSLKGGSERSLDLESLSQGARKLFLFGCLCLIALALFSAWGAKWKYHMANGGMCHIPKMTDKARYETAMPAAVGSESKKSTNGSTKSISKTDPVVSPETSKSSTVMTTSQDVSKPVVDPTPTATKSSSSGNGGNFRSGKIY